MDRAQLEQLALDKMSRANMVPSSSMDRAQLEEMALQKMSSMGMTEVNEEDEASLGFATRAKFAIEPMQSNRKALLEEKYGPENIMQNSKGDLYVRQNDQFVPVNKDGFSTADVADLVGAIPEAAGGVVGTVAGAVGGAGVASVPGAIALGSAGGAAGSAARQALSAAIGNPQVASLEERAVETGLSAAFGGAGTGLGLAAKAGINKVKPGITNIIKNLTKGTGEALETVGETTSKGSANTALEMAGNITPIYEKQTAEGITGAVADQSGRNVVQSEMENLKAIAKRQGLPDPTYAQAAQGKALIAEAKVMDTPLIGGKVRKQVDGQLKLIRNNIEKVTGKFIDADSDAFEVGQATREYADTAVSSVKKIASELYQEVEEQGADAMIGKRTFFNKFRDYAGELGVINPDLTPAKYAADSGLTRAEFDTVQRALFDGMYAIKRNPSQKIRFESVNALRKTMNGVAEELRDKSPNAARLVKKFGKELDLTVERVLNREHPELGEKFSAANKNWAKYKGQEEVLSKYLKADMGDENVVKSIMGNTAKIEALKEIIGEKQIKEIGKSYVRDIVEKLGKSGIGRADTALNEIKKRKAQIVASMGEDTYSNLVDNLHYLNRTGQSINVSRASLYNILDNRGPGLKQLGVNILGAGKTLMDSKGTTLTGAAKKAAIETTSIVVEKATSGKSSSAASNILTDGKQRAWSEFPKYGSNISEQEKEAQKRKRAISGSK